MVGSDPSLECFVAEFILSQAERLPSTMLRTSPLDQRSTAKLRMGFTSQIGLQAPLTSRHDKPKREISKCAGGSFRWLYATAWAHQPL